ncbi:hypothetical protein IAU60_006338 [Kwoniella sp. DSM 27419]
MPGYHAISLGFSAAVVLAASTWQWPVKWLLSGTPILSLLLLLGAANGTQVLPFLPVSLVLVVLNLVYAVAATSWLLYGCLTAFNVPAIFLVSIFQFDIPARLLRRTLRKALTQLQFVHDTIALFDIPALEIDVDVEGLMVIRGMTISLSTLTVVAHGIEVGIKLSDDMELAISTERCTVRLFRGVHITDCYANLKGGAYEMTFGELEPSEKDEDGDTLMVEATPLLRAAARPKMVKMRSQMTGGIDIQDSGAKSGWNSMRRLSPDDQSAHDQYKRMLDEIIHTNAIYRFRQQLDLDSRADLRAAICSKMQNEPTVPHPPKRSIKVTTLQNLSKPGTRRILHRLPMLLRLLLNPISYLHPVEISSITAAGSGKYISHMLRTHLFKSYSEDSKELRRLEKRILSWLADANFAVELNDIHGVASVPFISTYDILAQLKFGDVVAYRSLVDEVVLEQVVRLGGADATFTIPSYLLPHHEHLLPPVPTTGDKQELEEQAKGADGRPKEIQAERKLEQAEKDEANVRLSAHVQLPACFSQELLNFIAALVKATKVVEMEKEPGAMESKLSGLKDFGQALSKSMKDGMKKTVVDGVISDKWIAKMVGKITRQLESAQGDVGYTGDIPVKLEVYRLPEGHPELNKILA